MPLKTPELFLVIEFIIAANQPCDINKQVIQVHIPDITVYATYGMHQTFAPIQSQEHIAYHRISCSRFDVARHCPKAMLEHRKGTLFL